RYRGKPGQSLYEVFGKKPEESSAKPPISGREVIRKFINSNQIFKTWVQTDRNLLGHFKITQTISQFESLSRPFKSIEDFCFAQQRRLADKIRDFLRKIKDSVSKFLTLFLKPKNINSPLEKKVSSGNPFLFGEFTPRPKINIRSQLHILVIARNSIG
ncbi:MAG: hypothetical protein ACHQYQ_10385, partial [Bacteriovoracales bacterium]